MKYENLDSKFRELFFKLNSYKSEPQILDSIKIEIRALSRVNDDYCTAIERYKLNINVGTEIFFVKANRVLLNLRNGDKRFKIKSFNYTTAEVVKMEQDKITLKHPDGSTYKYNLNTIFEVGCWARDIF